MPKTAINGARIDLFQAGQVYNVSPSLAALLIAEGWGLAEMRSGDRRQRSSSDRTGEAGDRRLTERRQR